MIKRLYHLPLLLIFSRDLKSLEHDPVAQYKFNRWCAIFWFLQMVLVPVMIFYYPGMWLKIEFFYLTEASLWANFATHFGAMSAALAAMQTDKTVHAISEDVTDLSDDVDDIHDVVGVVPEVEPSLVGHPELWQLPVNSK